MLLELRSTLLEFSSRRPLPEVQAEDRVVPQPVDRVFSPPVVPSDGYVFRVDASFKDGVAGLAALLKGNGDELYCTEYVQASNASEVELLAVIHKMIEEQN